MNDKQKPPAAEPEKPLPAYPLDLAAELSQPDTTEKLLNAQLAEALFMIRDVGYVYRNTPDVSTYGGHIIQPGESLMQASAKIAGCIAQLKGAGKGRPLKPENE